MSTSKSAPQGKTLINCGAWLTILSYLTLSSLFTIAIFNLEVHCLAIDAYGFILKSSALICRSDKKSELVGAVFPNASVYDVDAELFSSGLNSIHFTFRSGLPKVVVGYVAVAVRMDKKKYQVRQETTNFGSPIMRLASGSRE